MIYKVKTKNKGAQWLHASIRLSSSTTATLLVTLVKD